MLLEANLITLFEVWRDYRNAHSLKLSTAKNYESVLVNCADDWLYWDITLITKELVEAKFRSLEATPAQANYLFKIIKALLNFASYKYENDDGSPLINNNPVKRLSELRLWYKVKPRKGHIPAHLMPEFFAAVNQEPNEIIRDLVYTLMMTGLRLNEATSLEWKNVNLKYRTIYIPDTKNGEDLTLPISRWLAYILAQRPKHGRLVLPIVNPYKGFRRIGDAIDHRFRPHDLRRTFNLVGRLAKVDPTTRRMLLNHSPQGVTSIHYDVPDLEEMREAVEKVADKYMELKRPN